MSERVLEFVERYVADYNRTTRDGRPRWNGQTEKVLTSSLQPFVRTFGTMKMRELGAAHPDTFRAWAQEQPAAYVQRTRSMLNDAVGSGLIGSNPLKHIRLTHGTGRRDITVLTADEIEELCAIARETCPGYPLEAMIAVAAYTCVRPGELFALRHEDVHLEDGTLDVRLSYNGLEMKRPKNGQERNGIVLLPQAAARIPKWDGVSAVCDMCVMDPHRGCRVCWGEGNVRWLFRPNGSARHFRKADLYRLWRPVASAFLRPDMAFYELRHAGATLLLEHGVEPEDVAWQMGHTDGGKLVRELYGEPHRAAQGRRERIREAMGA